MMFCPRCKSILRPGVERGKKVLVCSCGYSSKPTDALTISEKVKPSQNVEVVSEEKTVLPRTKVTCPKCGHDTAFYWMVQTRAGDEPETKFLRCEKCKHTWRDYS
jgi:DNA-directed RNA polymerase subunit M